MGDCIFCKIINKDIPSSKVFENEHVYAFKDINPQAKHHILVIPKKHVSSIIDADTETLNNIFSAIKDITITENINNSGFRIVTNNGPDAGQTVFHLHFHLIGGEKLSDRMA